MTYPKDGRVVWHLRRLRLCVFFLLLGYTDVFHITAAEDDVFVDTGGGGNLLGGVASPPFSAIGNDIFEGNGGGLGVDLM